MQVPETVDLRSPSLAIIGVGASAGGISALKHLFRALPASPNLAFVVVQHRLPEQSHTLVELIARWTTMCVRPALGGIRPERDYIYVAGADDLLTLEAGVFRAQPRSRDRARARNETVDCLLSSLAREHGRNAIGIVLSGSAGDGTAGALCIKQAGGTVFVQDPRTAQYGEMPETVIAAGAADYVLPVEAIALRLVANISSGYVRAAASVLGPDTNTHALSTLLGLIHQQSGLDLSAYKTPPLLWRIRQRMEARRVQSLEDYTALAQDDPLELDTLVRDIPIHETQFFRDPTAWETLEYEVLDPLMRQHRRNSAIRIWTPACSSGEEAYSLAMQLTEQTDVVQSTSEFKIVATDVSTKILARAATGVFSQAALEAVSPIRKARFFYAADGMYRVKASLRARIVFAPQDQLSAPPFSNLDLISCRSLLTYLDPADAQRALWLLHGSLRMGGYLFLGKNEGPPSWHTGLEPVSNIWRIYRKVGPATDASVSFPKGVPDHPVSSLSAAALPGAEVALIPEVELGGARAQLVSLNEELQAVKKQLNLSNHELQNIHIRLREKSAELEMQSQVLISGGVITLFLDTQLRVRWFTPAALEFFPLAAGDVGRLITDLAQRFDDCHFIRNLNIVIQTGTPLACEVRSHAARWFLLRMQSHASAGTSIRGVAVTFTNISEHRDAEVTLRASEERLQQILDCTQDAVEVIDKQWRVVYRNSAGQRMQIQRGIAPDSGIGQLVWEAYPTYLGSPIEIALRRTMEERVASSAEFLFPPTGRDYHARFFPINDGGISAYYHDVSERAAQERSLRERRDS